VIVPALFLLAQMNIVKTGTIVVPSGSTTAQIQALANKLSAAENVLYFNAGTYAITAPITIPCSFPSGVKVVGPDVTPATAILKAPSGSTVLTYSGCTAIEISRISVEAK
jgi:hypothetical protein